MKTVPTTKEGSAATLQRWKRDPMAFRREAILLEDGTPFGHKMEAWQHEDFTALDSSQYRHAYLERPRGHSKTGDIGTEALLHLVLGPRSQRLFCAATDEDQGKLLLDDVAEKAARHPLLRRLVKVTKRTVEVPATGSKLRVLTSDAPSAFGLRPDWIACDELSEWRRPELWHSLWSASGKRPRCRVLVISTAGWDRTSVGYTVRTIAQQEPDWLFSARGQCATWIAPEWLEQQRRTLPQHVFARLHESKWVEGVGAFLTYQEVSDIFTDELPAISGRVSIGCDLGIARDRSVVAVVHHHSSGLVIVEDLVTFVPRPHEKVSLTAVEERVASLARQHKASVTLDPWQGVMLAEKLRATGVPVHEYTFTQQNRRTLFSTLLDLVRTQGMRSRPHEALRQELLSLEVTDTSGGGWRVDHRKGSFDDHVVATALAIQGLGSLMQMPTYDHWFLDGKRIQSTDPIDPFDPYAEEDASGVMDVGWQKL